MLQVQDFIKSISRQEKEQVLKISKQDMLKAPVRRACRRSSFVKEQEGSRRQELGAGGRGVESRRPSVEVIVTSYEYDPNNLSTRDYDRLKKVGHEGFSMMIRI